MRKLILPLAILIVAFVALPSISALSALRIVVKTGKPTYHVEENISIWGNLTQNESLVQEELVAVEIQNPSHDPVLVRSTETDVEGLYSLTFRLPADSMLGTFAAYVGSSHNGQSSSNNATFIVTFLGDIDIDIDVDISDLHLFARSYDSTVGEPSYNQEADLDGNGHIDSNDLFIFTGNYGESD